jgi:outer membrane protein TolC
MACADAGSAIPIAPGSVVAQALQLQPQLLMARDDALAARSDVLAARAPFLPTVTAAITDERYVPANEGGPVVVVGNNVLGGPQTKSAYGALNLNWNLLSSGRDLAAYRGAEAGARAASLVVDSQTGDTLTGTLQAYADLHEAEISAANEQSTLATLKEIEARAEERYRNGHGTTVAIGQARASALDGEKSYNKSCRDVSDKSAALAAAIGVHLSADQRFSAPTELPMPVGIADERSAWATAIDNAPSVAAARQKVTQAEAKVRQSRAAFGPSLSVYARRDYLGQDADSFGRANHGIAPNDYRIGLTLEQPVFPLVSETAAVDRAKAELRRAQAGYEQARLEAETKLRNAINMEREARASYAAARTSADEARKVLELTQSQYKAGRADLDSVQKARMDLEKADTEVGTLASRRVLAGWLVFRAVAPERFSKSALRRLQVDLEEGRWSGMR